MSKPPLKRGSNSSSIVSTASVPLSTRQWVSQRPADAMRLLYPRCAQILASLQSLPPLEPYLKVAGCDTVVGGISSLPPHLNFDLGVAPAGFPYDPVTLVWRVLRLGAPLSVLFNLLDTKTQLEVLEPELCLELQPVKRSLYHFFQACKTELGLSDQEELFTIMNVFNDSTSELLRPLKTMQLLLDRLSASGVLPVPASPSATTFKFGDDDIPQPQDQRDKVANELLQTERKYVQDLELMVTYQDAMLAANVPREIVQKIFPFLSKMVNFQRRFLVGVEYQARLKPEDQQFGWLFAQMRREFTVYEGFTLCQREAADTALAEVPTLMAFSHILEPMYELQAMILKPVQRVCKYPLLLKEMLKCTPPEWAYYNELRDGLTIMQAMVAAVNETQRKVENKHVRVDLSDRLKDWKGLDLSAMGELLLNGTFPVLSLGESEAEYNLYLFEKMLLCCRDKVAPKKTPLGKMRPTRSSSQSKSMSLELKGRIYMSYVTTVHVTKLPQPGQGYLLSLGWGRNDASEIGSFEIRMASEEQAALWESTISRLVPLSEAASYSSTLDLQAQKLLGYEDDASSVVGAKFYEEQSPQSPVDALRKLSVSSDRSRWSATTDVGGILHHQYPYNANRSSQVSQSTPVSAAPSASASALYLPMLQMPKPRLPDGIELNGQRKVRMYVQSDSFLILVSPEISFETLQNRVERKLRLCGKPVASPLRIRYCDEDNDFVLLASDDDLQVALDSVHPQEELTLHVV